MCFLVLPLVKFALPTGGYTLARTFYAHPQLVHLILLDCAIRHFMESARLAELQSNSRRRKARLLSSK
jgi:hypothetical protein